LTITLSHAHPEESEATQDVGKVDTRKTTVDKEESLNHSAEETGDKKTAKTRESPKTEVKPEPEAPKEEENFFMKWVHTVKSWFG